MNNKKKHDKFGISYTQYNEKIKVRILKTI